MKTICDTHDDIGKAILEGDEDKALKLLAMARKQGERMECRLKRYYRAIELLGFKRVRKQ